MHWSDLPLNPSPRMLRQFAGLLLTIFGALALWHGLGHAETRLAAALASVAVVGGGVGLIWPAAIRPLFVAWMVVAFPIGWVVSRVALAVLFVLVTIVAVGFRLAGRDHLRLKRRAGETTYWTPKTSSNDARSYLHQF